MKQSVPIVLMLLIALPLIAQQGEVLHRASGEDPLTVRSGLALVAALAGAVSSDQPVAPEEAQAALARLGYKLPTSAPEDPLNYGEFSLLVMQAFDMRGGLRYELVPSPAVAFKELDRRLELSPGLYTGTPISGIAAVDILHHLLVGGL